MDPLTAGIAFSITQLCIAAIMAGTYFAIPDERYTRFWALSGILTASGVTIIVFNATRPAGIMLWLGNVTLFSGGVLIWLGLRAFFQQEIHRWGYYLIAWFSFIFMLLIAGGADFTLRACFTSASLLLLFGLYLQTLLCNSDGRKFSYARYWLLLVYYC